MRLVTKTKVSGLLLIASMFAFGCGQTNSDTPAAAASAAPIAPLAPGEIFPAGTYRNLNPDPGGQIDLGPVIGTRPVVLYYWVPGNARSEEIFRELEALAREVGEEQLALYGIAVPRPNASAQAIAGRIGAQGFRFKAKFLGEKKECDVDGVAAVRKQDPQISIPDL